jgi:hypothetical protein
MFFGIGDGTWYWNVLVLVILGVFVYVLFGNVTIA